MTDSTGNKILICCDWYVPGYKAGGPIQSCKNLVDLLKTRYEVFVLTSDRDLGDEKPYPSVKRNQWIEAEDHLHIYYAGPKTVNAAFLQQVMNEIDPAFVYLNSMFSYPFAILPVRVALKSAAKPQIILAPRGMLHAGALRFKKAKKLLFLKLFKWLKWSKRIHFHATDEQEVEDIRKYFPHNQITLINNIPNHSPSDVFIKGIKKQGQVKLVFLSRISPKKNLHDLLKWMKQYPLKGDWSLDVYGNHEDADYYKECKALIKDLPVTFKGAVKSEKVKSVLSKYHCFILPTKGENFGHAIFESLSSGVPVIISDQTPWRNLHAQKAGYDISLSAPEKFIDAVQAFVDMDNTTWFEWTQAASRIASDYVAKGDYQEKYFRLFS